MVGGENNVNVTNNSACTSEMNPDIEFDLADPSTDGVCEDTSIGDEPASDTYVDTAGDTSTGVDFATGVGMGILFVAGMSLAVKYVDGLNGQPVESSGSPNKSGVRFGSAGEPPAIDSSGKGSAAPNGALDGMGFKAKGVITTPASPNGAFDGMGFEGKVVVAESTFPAGSLDGMGAVSEKGAVAAKGAHCVVGGETPNLSFTETEMAKWFWTDNAQSVFNSNNEAVITVDGMSAEGKSVVYEIPMELYMDVRARVAGSPMVKIAEIDAVSIEILRLHPELVDGKVNSLESSGAKSAGGEGDFSALFEEKPYLKQGLGERVKLVEDALSEIFPERAAKLQTARDAFADNQLKMAQRFAGGAQKVTEAVDPFAAPEGKAKVADPFAAAEEKAKGKGASGNSKGLSLAAETLAWMDGKVGDSSKIGVGSDQFVKEAVVDGKQSTAQSLGKTVVDVADAVRGRGVEGKAKARARSR